jgi:type I restriction enzyme, R subunit
VLQDYHDDGSGKTPRYYQVNAVNASIEAIAKGQDRISAGDGHRHGQDLHRVPDHLAPVEGGPGQADPVPGRSQRAVDQTMVNDFRPFGGGMAKLSTSAKTIERDDGSTVTSPLALTSKRRIDTAYEIYLGLYQAITGPEERQKLFKEFSPDFFDLIVIDECHRGSAAEDSAWREILEYFSSATQIGMTATPKETQYVSNIAYFGEPVYTYSLKQGIRDGFLAPYKVIKVHIDRDVEGYRPEKGQVDRYGEEIEDRIYNPRTSTGPGDRRPDPLVAQKVTEFLKDSGDRFQKTIVFCVDQEHAARMRQALINENADLVGKNQRYVMRITGNDPEGQAQLGNFMDPGVHLSRPGHHLAAAVHRRRCPDLPADRARPGSGLHDRVQADRRSRHPGPRGHPEVLLHADGFPGRDQSLCRSRLRWRAGADLRTRRRRAGHASR